MPLGSTALLGYLAVASGAFVEGEAVMLSAGALAHAGKLQFAGVVLSGTIGSFAWGQTWFRVGRALGPALLVRRPAWQARAAVVERWLARAGVAIVLGGRFLPGMGTVLPAMIGASGFGSARFVLLDALGALLWSAVVAGLGLGLGRGLERLGGEPLGLELIVGVALVLGLQWALNAVVGRRSARRASHLAPTEPGVAPVVERRVVVTGDDFGLALPFNEAIELAYARGVLTTASLMLGEDATADAIDRAHRNPGLCVGLHLALCEAKPVSAPAEVPRLVNAKGVFFSPVQAIVGFALRAPSRAFRAELEAEIRAQFSAFAATGLRCDHVSGHNNLHLHPAVLPHVVRVAREFGVTAIRVPYEPFLAAWRATRTHLVARFFVWAVMGPWTAWARRRLRNEGFAVNDQIFGVFDCGSMTLDRLLAIARQLPAGATEIHVHPATRRCPEIEQSTPSYAHEAELTALLSPELRRALHASDVKLVAGYRGLIALVVLVACSALGCATLPPERAERSLYLDLRKIAEADGGWTIDALRVQQNLELALRSSCEVPRHTRAELDAWLTERIQLAGGPAESQYRAHGNELAGADESVSLERTRLLLRAAEANAEKCPFWLSPNAEFSGAQGDFQRWVGLAETQAFATLLVPHPTYALGGGGRLFLGRGIGPRTTIALGGELAASATFIPVNQGIDSYVTVAMPVLYRWSEFSKLFDVEVAPVARFGPKGKSWPPGARVELGAGFSSATLSSFMSYLMFYVGYEVHGFGHEEATDHTFQLGTRLGVDWSPSRN